MTKKVCEKCGRKIRIRNVVCFKGKYLCSNCKPKNIPLPFLKGFTLKRALEKEYNVTGYLTKKNSLEAKIHVPSILIGKKVKLILVDKNSKTETFK